MTQFPEDPNPRGEIRHRHQGQRDLHLNLEYSLDESAIHVQIEEYREKRESGHISSCVTTYLIGSLIEMVARVRQLRDAQDQSPIEPESELPEEDQHTRNARVQRVTDVFLEFQEPELAWLYRYEPTRYALAMAQGSAQMRASRGHRGD